jgi:hypothetical protein
LGTEKRRYFEAASGFYVQLQRVKTQSSHGLATLIPADSHLHVVRNPRIAGGI